MESKNQTPSVILQLMGLDKVPPQHPVRDKQKVLSEKYLQKVASVGVRKKRSSHQHHSFRMSTDEKEESEDVLKVVKTIRRDKHHSPSKGNGKENPCLSGTKVKGLQQQPLNAACVSVNRKPKTLVESISSFNLETSVKSGRIAEQGILQQLQKVNNGLQKDVHGEAGLYEIFRCSKSQLDLKDGTFNPRIVVLEPNPGNGGNGLKYFSFPSSCKNSHLADGVLKDIFHPKSTRVYSEMKDRKKMSDHMDLVNQSPRSFGKVSEEVSIQTGNAESRVLDTVSSSFFRRNEAFAKRSDLLKDASNISVNDRRCNSLFWSEAKKKTMEQLEVTEKLQVGQWGQGSIHHQLPTISEHGYGARNLTYQNGFVNDKVKTSIGCKIAMKYSSARKVAMGRPLCAASVIAGNHGTWTKDGLFHKYWGLRKNASSNWSTQKSKNQDINQQDCSDEMNLRFSSEKSLSSSSYFYNNNNHIEDNCIGLHKLKKRCYGNDLSDKKSVLPQLSRSGTSSTFTDSQTMDETCLMKDEAKNNKHEDSNMFKQNIATPNSSIDCLVSDAKTEVVGRLHNNPKKQQSESTASILLQEDMDSLSHTSCASMQQDTSEFQEDSVYSLCSETEPDSLSSFEEAYEPSPISVLDPSFRDDISFSSECLKFGSSIHGSSEMEDEGLGLNVSSDEDCRDEYMGDLEEKQDLARFFRAEESRDFSYVVEVLTEAGISNRTLFTDFSTWHSAECPISPSVFEILEKKFGEQQFWKRSERRLLFDRINVGLMEILRPCSYIPVWEKALLRRLNAEPSQDMIEEEMWGLLVAQEKKASKESADKMLGGEISWIELGDDIEVIVIEIVKLLIEELAGEIVSLENF